jgi:ribosomal protein L37E
MALAKCARCEKLFSKVQAAVCPACEPLEEADYEKVRNVLAGESGLNAEQVAVTAEVSIDCVLRMLADGRIESGGESEAIRCGRCGRPAISATKRLCESCLTKLDQECAEALRTLRETAVKKSGPESRPVHEILEAKRQTPKEERRDSKLKRRPAPEKAPAPGRRMVFQERRRNTDKGPGGAKP